MTTNQEAAAAYCNGLRRILCLQDGATEAMTEAVTADPGFALGHAALAILRREQGAWSETANSFALARGAVLARGDDRERSFVAAMGELIDSRADSSDSMLTKHV